MRGRATRKWPFFAAGCLAFLISGPAVARAASNTEELSLVARAAISRAIRDLHPGSASAGSAQFFEEAKLTASDGAASDELGTSVAVSGDTVVVGVNGTNGGTENARGAAYVFVKPAGGWGTAPPLEAKLTASDGAPFDGFGWSVAISGDTIVVGAPFAAVNSNLSEGAAYVFVKPYRGWKTTSAFDSKLTASDATRITFFGLSVAISGGTVVVGAPGTMIGTYYAQGAAYLFVEPPSGWATTSAFDAKLTASDGILADQLGASVAISGDTVVAGTASTQMGLNPGLGKAYVFVRPPAGWATTSEFQAKLTASDGVPGDYFGSPVATSGDAVIVGAPGAGPGGIEAEGAAYVFARPTGGWKSSTEDARLTPSDGGVLDYFGTSVGISGGTVVIGALQAMVAGEPSAAGFSSEAQTAYLNSGLGVAYVFVKPTSGWSTTSQFNAKVSAADELMTASRFGNGFGSSVGFSGDTLVVGAPAGDVGSNPYQGAAYVFERCPSASGPGGPPCIQSLDPPSPAPMKGRQP